MKGQTSAQFLSPKKMNATLLPTVDVTSQTCAHTVLTSRIILCLQTAKLSRRPPDNPRIFQEIDVENIGVFEHMQTLNLDFLECSRVVRRTPREFGCFQYRPLISKSELCVHTCLHFTPHTAHTTHMDSTGINPVPRMVMVITLHYSTHSKHSPQSTHSTPSAHSTHSTHCAHSKHLYNEP